MTVMNVQDAKPRLSALIAEAEAGAEVAIARHGRPVVKLVPVAPPAVQLGFWAQAWSDQDEADALAPLDEAELALWG